MSGAGESELRNYYLKSFQFQQPFHDHFFDVVARLDSGQRSPVSNAARRGDEVEGSQRLGERVSEQVDGRDASTSTKTGGTETRSP